jgi:quinol monooxygenase YgiN
MPIYTIAEYRVRRSGAERVKRAIEEFVRYVKANEPGTRTYLAWQRKDDPTGFVHFFIFEDEAAHKVHSGSEAVKRFEAVYRPELIGGDVVFTDYEWVAGKQE